MKTLAIFPLMLVLAIASRSDAQQVNADGDSMSTAPVVSSVVNYSGMSDVRAVYGMSEPSGGFGVGGHFVGGLMGLQGIAGNELNNFGPSAGVLAQNYQAGSTERFGIFADVGGPSTGPKVAGYFTTLGMGNYGVFSTNPSDSGFAGYFDGHLRVIANNDQSFGFKGLTIDQPNAPTPILASFNMTYSSLPDSAGFALFARDAGQGGGINLGATNGFAYQSIYAEDFVVSSDDRMKDDIEFIQGANSKAYMVKFRNLRPARFRYKFGEIISGLQYGIIAQSAPKEMLGTTTERPDGTGEKRLAVKLASWLGLVTVAAQENDRRLSELEAENERLRKENATILRRLEALERKLE